MLYAICDTAKELFAVSTKGNFAIRNKNINGEREKRTAVLRQLTLMYKIINLEILGVNYDG